MESVPKEMRAKYEEIVGITDLFCAEHLNEKFGELARRMTAKLARKRPSPLLSGNAHSWAAAVLYALGKVNALFYVSNELHMKARDLSALLGVSESHAANKARDILKMLKIEHFDPRRPIWKQSLW